MKYYIYVLITLIVLLFSCSDSFEEIQDTGSLISTRTYKSNLEQQNQLEKSKHIFNDELPHEYRKALKKHFGLKHDKVYYNQYNGEITFGDVVIHENYLVEYIIDKRIFKGEKGTLTKGYTFSPNHTYDPNVSSPIRCEWGQTNSDFENYQVITTYSFASNFPSQYKNLVNSSFDQWESASNQKFIFNEQTTGGYLSIDWEPIFESGVIANARFPIWTQKRYNVGDRITFDPEYWDPTTGSYIQNYTSAQVNQLFINTCLHEIGHNLGLSHFHDADEQKYHHVAGSAVDVDQYGISVMSYNSDDFRTTLYPDDILTIQTLYPYNGSGLQCQTESGLPDILN